MKQTMSIYAVMLSALVGLWFTTAAHAQMQVNTDGRANEANNRVGSAGLNNVKIDMSKLPTGNDIINGTVTGGWAFQGHVPYFAPGAFHGNLPGTFMDNFIRDSSGGGSVNNAQQHTVYYGENQQVAPPGFVRDPITQAYVAPSPMQEAQSLNLNGPLDTTLQPLPLPGQISTSGQVDPTAPNAQVLMATASPLYGVRQWQTNQQGESLMANPLQAATPGQQQNTTGAAGPLSQEQIIQMRQQLYKTVVAPTPVGPENNVPATVNPGQSAPLSPLLPGGTENTGTTSGNPAGQSLSPISTAGQGHLNPLLPGGTEASQSLPAPGQQSTQYAQMQNRMQQFEAQHPLPAGQTYEQLLAAVRGHRPQMGDVIGPKPANTATPIPALTPANPPVTGHPQTVEPLRVKSLAEGFSAKTLADLLTNAETMVRDQKYDQAIRQYNVIIQVVPNNPMILLGRANAELGGLYFVKAEADIRTAIMMDKTVLIAQFDLDHLYGQAQRDTVIDSLKRIATAHTDNPSPVILLAYISYNLQDEDKAQRYLELAQQRAGGLDPFIALLQRYWIATPQSTTRPTDAANK